MTWDDTVGIGTVINVVLFIGAITAIFMRRDKDMESHKASIKTHGDTITEINKMLAKLTESHCRLANAHSELKGRVDMMANSK